MPAGQARQVEEHAARTPMESRTGHGVAIGRLEVRISVHWSTALDEREGRPDKTIDGRIDVESAYWLSLARHPPLGILTDLDGTLVPFAPTPDRRASHRRVHAARRTSSSSCPACHSPSSAVGRARARRFLSLPPRQRSSSPSTARWRSGPAGWERMVSLDQRAVESLAADLRLAEGPAPRRHARAKDVVPRASLPRGPPAREDGALGPGGRHRRALARCAPRLRETLRGSEVLEIRPALGPQGERRCLGPHSLGPKCRLLLVGDDMTDEDMFAAASPTTRAILVGAQPDRVTAAQWRLGGSDEVLAFYRWIVSLRKEALPPPPSRRPSRVQTLPSASGALYDLLVLSNRLPELRSAETALEPSKRNVGGLVSALAPVLTPSARHLARLERTHEAGRDRGDRREPGGRRPSRACLGRLSGGVAPPLLQRPEQQRALAALALVSGPRSILAPGLERVRASQRGICDGGDEARETRPPRSGCTTTTCCSWASSFAPPGIAAPVGLFQHIPFPGPDIFFLLPLGVPNSRGDARLRSRGLSHRGVRR